MPPIHIAHEAVVTPWEQKGLVMRTLVERSKGRDLVLVDGVKVHRGRRVGPGPARPRGAGHPRVGRGPERTQAEARAQEYAIRLEHLLQ